MPNLADILAQITVTANFGQTKIPAAVPNVWTEQQSMFIVLTMFWSNTQLFYFQPNLA